MANGDRILGLISHAVGAWALMHDDPPSMVIPPQADASQAKDRPQDPTIWSRSSFDTSAAPPFPAVPTRDLSECHLRFGPLPTLDNYRQPHALDRTITQLIHTLPLRLMLPLYLRSQHIERTIDFLRTHTATDSIMEQQVLQLAQRGDAGALATIVDLTSDHPEHLGGLRQLANGGSARAVYALGLLADTQPLAIHVLGELVIEGNELAAEGLVDLTACHPEIALILGHLVQTGTVSVLDALYRVAQYNPWGRFVLADLALDQSHFYGLPALHMLNALSTYIEDATQLQGTLAFLGVTPALPLLADHAPDATSCGVASSLVESHHPIAEDLRNAGVLLPGCGPLSCCGNLATTPLTAMFSEYLSARVGRRESAQLLGWRADEQPLAMTLLEELAIMHANDEAYDVLGDLASRHPAAVAILGRILRNEVGPFVTEDHGRALQSLISAAQIDATVKEATALREMIRSVAREKPEIFDALVDLTIQYPHVVAQLCYYDDADLLGDSRRAALNKSLEWPITILQKAAPHSNSTQARRGLIQFAELHLDNAVIALRILAQSGEAWAQ